MGNKPLEDIQVENETVEPYRRIMIFRTLQKGTIVGADGAESKRSFPAQTFFACLSPEQIKMASAAAKNADGILVGGDVESVRAQIDRAFPGTGDVVAPDPPTAAPKAKGKAAGKGEEDKDDDRDTGKGRSGR